jgi:hypothetical protein
MKYINIMWILPLGELKTYKRSRKNTGGGNKNRDCVEGENE